MTGSKTKSEAQITDFMPIKDLFVSAWDLFVDRLGQMVVLILISFAFAFICSALFVFILFFILGSYLGLSLANLSNFNFESLLSKIDPSILITFGLVLVIFVIVFIIFQAIVSIASILIIGSDEKITLSEAFKKGFNLIIPLFLTSFFLNLVIFGGLWLFVFPAIIFTIFLAWTNLEVVLSGKKYFQALKGSYTIVSQNFGPIFVRWLAFLGLYIVFLAIIPGILNSVSESLTFMSGIITFLANLILPWLSMAYFILLYKEAKEQTDWDTKTSLAWVYIVSLIGWIVGIVMIVGMVFVFGNLAKQGLNSLEKGDFKQEIINDLDKELNLDIDKTMDENFLGEYIQNTTDAEYGEVATTLKIKKNGIASKIIVYGTGEDVYLENGNWDLVDGQLVVSFNPEDKDTYYEQIFKLNENGGLTEVVAEEENYDSDTNSYERIGEDQNIDFQGN
ncbi:hypothetical protein GYA19_04295 [Candidatus Beckwithbacteria bacterium]|nr:hypothetical protein [Candidatus Beckwithbacteria bacterium]